MKKIIFILVMTSSNLFSEHIDKKLIEERINIISKKINEKNQIDDEYRWYQGYLCSLEYILSIIN